MRIYSLHRRTCPAVPASRPMAESLEPRLLMRARFIDSQAGFDAISFRTLKPGDVVLFRGGSTFTGTLQLDRRDGGNADRPVVIGSYDPATRQLVSADAPPSARATISAGLQDGIKIYNTAGITIFGINLIGAGPTVNSDFGIDAYTDLPGDVKLSGLVIDHVDVTHFGEAGIAIGSGAGTSGFSNVTITNVAAHENGAAGITTYAPFVTGQPTLAHRNVYIGYCTAYDNEGYSNVQRPTGSGILLSGASDSVIEHCFAYGNGSSNTSNTGPHGIWAWNVDHVTIQYNTSENNQSSFADGGGFGLDGGSTNSVLQFNYAHNNAGAGFQPFQFTGAGPWANNTVRNNIGVMDANVEVIILSTGPVMDNLQMYNNTFIVNGSNSPWVIIGTDVHTDIHDNVVLSNQTVDTSGVGFQAGVLLPGGSPLAPLILTRRQLRTG